MTSLGAAFALLLLAHYELHALLRLLQRGLEINPVIPVLTKHCCIEGMFKRYVTPPRREGGVSKV